MKTTMWSDKQAVKNGTNKCFGHYLLGAKWRELNISKQLRENSNKTHTLDQLFGPFKHLFEQNEPNRVKHAII